MSHELLIEMVVLAVYVMNTVDSLPVVMVLSKQEKSVMMEIPIMLMDVKMIVHSIYVEMVLCMIG